MLKPALALSALLALSIPAAKADLSEITTTDMSSRTDTADNVAPSGTSQAQASVAESHERSQFSASSTSMVFGPALNNLQGAPVALVPGKPPMPAGYTVRQLFGANYRFGEASSIGPVVDFMESFFGPRANHVVLNDPQIRYMDHGFARTGLWGQSLSTALWLSAYFPVGDLSISSHSVGGVSATLTPMLPISGTRFSVSGMASLKIGGYQGGATGFFTSERAMLGLAGNYRISAPLKTFLMLHASAKGGPDVPITDPGLTAFAFAKERGAHPVGLISGLEWRVGRALSVAPRLNWFLDQPIAATTVSLSALLRTI